MKKPSIKFLTALLVNLLISLKAQQIPSTPISFNALLNTGINGSLNGLEPIGNPDPHWTVTGPGANSSAAKVSASTGCSWAGNSTQFPFSQWIVPPALNCGGAWSNYNCQGGTDWTYDCAFWLPATPNPPIFRVELIVFADGWVEDIAVNGSMAYKSYYSPFSNHPNHMNQGMVFRWCSNWVIGLNHLTIHVKCDPATPGNCKHTGIKVESWGPGVNAYPAISGSTLVCAGLTNRLYSVPHQSLLGVPNGVAATFTWTKPAASWGSNNSTTSTLSATSGTNSGILYTKLQSISGTGAQTNVSCYATAGLSITVPQAITITPTPTSICQGACVTLSASGANTYTWLAPGNVTIGNSTTVSVCPNATSTYTVKGQTLLGGCTYSKTVVVNVLVKPAINLSSTTPTICKGKSAVLLAGSNFVLTYTYLTTPQLTVNPITVTPSVSTTYTVRGKHPNGCTNTATTQITVLPNPTLVTSASPSVICQGSSSTLSVSGAVSQTWTPGGVTATSVFVNSPAFSSNYTVTGTAPNGCTTQATQQLVVLTAPTVTINPPFICKNITNTMTAGGASTYTWYLGTSPVTTLTGASITFSIQSASMPYTVCGTSAANGCSACTIGMITQGTAVQLTVPDVTLCTNSGNCVTVAATSTLNAPINYTWFPGGMNGSSATMCPTVQTIYTVSATSPSGCPADATMQVVMAPTNCCNGSGSLTPLTGIGGIHPPGASYFLNNSQTLTASAYFTNSEVWITPGVSITVPSGMELSIHASHLFACGLNMWQGIVVKDGGKVVTPILIPWQGSSMIEDAIVGIDLDSITLNHALPFPIELQRMIFNKNYIGIKISNSVPALNAIRFGIYGCIFASRSMSFSTFPNPMGWPSADMVGAGLKAVNFPTTGLEPPYMHIGFPQYFPQTNLKLPYNNQPGHIGIKIENIGNTAGMIPTSGVDINQSVPGPIQNDFNLFDGLGVGIDVTDASLTTRFNVFQNMQHYFTGNAGSGWFGGEGIRDSITGLMNAKLILNQNFSGTPSTSEGNRFWNCMTGVRVYNVFDVLVNYNIFRSNHSAGSALFPQYMAGDYGIKIETNRFHFWTTHNEFNNLKVGLHFSTPAVTQNYEFPGTGVTAGIYAMDFGVEHSYFGARETSTIPYSGGMANTPISEYMSDGIKIETPNTIGWFNPPLLTQSASWVVFSKFDRVFRGVTVNGLADRKFGIIGNRILVEDDHTFGNPAFGYGISLSNNMDRFTISTNTISVTKPWHITPDASVTAIYCENNQGTNSPAVTCNTVTGAHYGFQFEQANDSTVWENNFMCENWAGLALTNNGVIGQQGNTATGNGNFWDCGPWVTNNTSQFETFAENSDPTLSPLYVMQSPPNPVGFEPINNNSNGAFSPYDVFPPQSIFYTSANVPNYCWGALDPTVPWWRTANQNTLTTNLKEEKFEASAKIYPNPTNGQLNIDVPAGYGKISITVSDMAGKVVYLISGLTSANNSIDLTELASTIYIIEIKNEDNNVIRKKLIKTE